MCALKINGQIVLIIWSLISLRSLLNGLLLSNFRAMNEWQIQSVDPKRATSEG